MSRAENPVLNFPPVVRKIQKNMKKGSKLGAVMGAYLFPPEETGKNASSREMSSNGAFTTGNLQDSSAGRGKWEIKNFIEAAVKFIEEWKKIE